jgi:orotate phosphoribosyltransferase
MGMTAEMVRAKFVECGAILEGHFLLSSGLHSPTYLQCARVLCHPEVAAELGRELAGLVGQEGVGLVVSPALGGLIIGHEVARSLGVRHLFTERVEGRMVLRRGFTVEPGERFLVVEDVLTTGGSTREVITALEALGAVPAAAAAIIHRGAGDAPLPVPFHSLLRLEIPSWVPDACPLCRRGGPPAVKPGSRNLS